MGVDAQFFSQLRRILPVCIPSTFLFCQLFVNSGVTSREFALLIFLAISLIARTGLDIWFSAFNGVVVRSIVSRDWTLFVKNALILFGVMMWPMSIVNNFLKLTINRLSLSFRSRLTHYAHEEYLKGITFYQVANLDNRIQNADQLLTQVFLSLIFPRILTSLQKHWLIYTLTLPNHSLISVYLLTNLVSLLD